MQHSCVISQVIIVSMTQPYYNAVQLSIEHSVTPIVMKLTSDLDFNCNNLPVLVNILTVTGVKHNFAINFLNFSCISHL